MMNLAKTIILLIVCFGCLNQSFQAQTTEFTYQGNLKNGANPATGNYDFEFLLFDTVSGGTQIGATLTRSSVAVADGNFSVKLDFGGQFPGANRFLEIHVRQTGGGGYTPLSPRQAVTSSPYSVKSLNTDQLGGVTANQYLTITNANASYIQNQNAVTQTGNFSINGTGTANILRAETQFNIGANRVLGSRCPNNLNVGIGAGAGEDVSCGFSGNTRNSFFGTNAGFSNVFGSDNVFVGFESGRNASSGQRNTFVGVRSGFSNGLGGSNTYLGYNAGENSGSLANANTFIGASTGLSNTMSGQYITIVGFQANVSSDGFLNATAIGANSLVSQSNSLVLGSIANVNGATADTNVGIGTSAPNFKLHVVGENVRVDGNTTGTFPRFSLNFTGGGANQKKWQNYALNNALHFTALNDAEDFETYWLQVIRGAGTTITSVVFPNGNVVINNLGAAGSTSLCRNALNEISTCTPGNLSEPQTTQITRQQTQITKQQTQIESQQKQIDEQNQLIKLQKEKLENAEKQMNQQKLELEALKVLVCSQNPTAELCKPKE